MDEHDEENSIDEHDEENLNFYYREKTRQNKYPLKIYEYDIVTNMSQDDIDDIEIGDDVYFGMKDDNEYYMGIKISPTEFIYGENDTIGFDMNEFNFFKMTKKGAMDFFTPDDSDNYVVPKKDKVNRTNFAGYGEIIDGGLTYLLYKHNNGCILLDNSSANPEMRYKNGEIEIKNGFFGRFISCLRGEKRFVLWRLTLVSPNNKQAHANLMMYDKDTRIVERFDPHGLSNVDWISDRRIDYEIQKKLSYIQELHIAGSITPPEICPIGPQSLENFVRDTLPSDPGGFCGAWALWYADLRLSNPDIPRPDIVLLAIKNIEEDIIMDEYNNMSFTSFIRNYAEFIYRITKIFQRYGNNDLDKIKRVIMTDKPLGLLIDGSRSLKRGPVDLSDYAYRQMDEIEDMLDKVLMIVEHEGFYYEGMCFDNSLYFYLDGQITRLPLLGNMDKVWVVIEKN